MKTKTQKLNFAEIGKTLSREEMKQIMAGSGSDSCPTDNKCDPPCSDKYGNCSDCCLA